MAQQKAQETPRPAIDVPLVESLESILHEEPLLMMGAGPVPIPGQVARANSIVINHLGEQMTKVIDQMKIMARYVFQTKSPWILGVAGPGSAAMEMSICNLVNKNTRVLSVVNGYFSARLGEMAERNGAEVDYVLIPEGQSTKFEDVIQKIDEFKPEVLTIVHGETSSTVLNRQLKEIAAAASERGCFVIVDAVCTLSTMPLDMDEWKLDAVISGGQKGLSSIPGVSLIAFSERAWDRIQNNKNTSPHWCLDAKLASKFWHGGSYHYTAPVSGILALHEALHLVCIETLPKRFERHLRCSRALQKGIQAMGLRLYGPNESRLNSVVGVAMPEGIDRNVVCKHISQNYRVEIAGSFGSDIVRIGQMGEQCRAHNLFRTLHALGSTMKDLGVKVDVPAGMAELERSMYPG